MEVVASGSSYVRSTATAFIILKKWNVAPAPELSFLRQEFENENARSSVGCVSGGHLTDRMIRTRSFEMARARFEGFCLAVLPSYGYRALQHVAHARSLVSVFWNCRARFHFEQRHLHGVFASQASKGDLS